MGDALSGIVDNDGELVGGECFSSPDDKIAGVLLNIDSLRARESVVENDIADAGGEAVVLVSLVEASCGDGGSLLDAEDTGRFVFGVRCARSALGLGAAELAGVCKTLLAQDFHGQCIVFEIVRLPDGPLVPVDADPFEEFDGLLVGAGFGPRAVEILDSEEYSLAFLLGENPVDEECSDVSEVEGPCGRGRDSGSGGSGWSVGSFVA